MDLMQDLVKTNHIFCDKTGTLTKNQLIFRNMIFEDSNFSADEGMDKFKSQLKDF
jgi:magnesium-transporting ATPase (P-type)